MESYDFDVVVAGHLCLDMFPRFQTDIATGRIGDILRPGTLVNMGGMAFGTGGAVSNTGIAMKIFGCRVAFVARVGDDPLARITRQVIERHGSTEGLSVSPRSDSSYTVILAAPNIDRIFLHCPGANDEFTAADLNPRVLERARLFHFGYPTLMRSMFADGGEELTRILKQAKGLGLTVSLDTSLPDPTSPAGKADWRRIYQKALPYVDLFVPSIEETFYTLHPAEYLRRKEQVGGDELIDHIRPIEFSRFADEYLALGCRVAVIKAGHNGWYVKTSGRAKIEALGRARPADPASWASRELWCPAFVVEKIASAAGAGDCSIAGFLTGLLRGHSLEECLRLANAAGAMNLRAIDTVSGLSSWEELQTAMAAMGVRPLDFLKDGWAWNQVLQLWERGGAAGRE
jgi:sugar/nucleoside kinase (ribokinase family)